jgi:hypothetical protein
MVLGDRLQHYGVALAANMDLVALEAEFLREANSLRTAGPEELGDTHGRA